MWTELNVSVLNTDYGLGIISKKEGNRKEDYQIPDDIHEYKTLCYSYLETDRKNILNLKDLEELDTVINSHLIN